MRHCRPDAYGNPVAPTPHTTTSDSDEFAGSVASAMPAPCSAPIVGLPGQIAPPVAAVQLTDVHTSPAVGGSVKTDPSAAFGPRLVTVTV